MCFFGRSRPAAPPRPEFSDAPPVVTGSQTGVESPINTAKATEELKIKRQETEGFENPGESLKLAGITGGGNKTAQQKANLAANRTKAKAMATARKNKKSFSNRAKGV